MKNWLDIDFDVMQKINEISGDYSLSERDAWLCEKEMGESFRWWFAGIESKLILVQMWWSMRWDPRAQIRP